MILPDFSNAWLAAGTGFVMGLQHATDVDHVVAVSTIVSRTRRVGSAWVVGAAWGAGHTVTLLLAGGAILGLRWSASAALARALESAVGMMLVALGIAAIAGLRGSGLEHEHAHRHEPDGSHGHHVAGRGDHSHRHMHLPELEALAHDAKPRLGPSFLVGMMHGLAGSSAIGLALVAALPGPAAAFAYLALFGLGTLAGMSVLSAFLSASMIKLAGVAWIERWLGPGLGAISVSVGLLMLGGRRP